MAKQKKTSVEILGLTHLADDCEWIDYLESAVATTCERLGWNYIRERETQTFRKLKAWFPGNKPVSPDRALSLLDASLIPGVNIFIDTRRPGQELRHKRLPVFSLTGEDEQEVEAFLGALDTEVRNRRQEWEKKHGGAVLPVEQSPTLVGGEKPAAAQPPQTGAGGGPKARVPTRPAHKKRWCAIWKNVRGEWNKGLNYQELAEWYNRTHTVKVAADTLADIIRAGEAGLLDT